MRNGYKAINFKGIDLSSGATIPGIYEAVESSYPDKAIVLTDVNLTGDYSQTINAAYTIDDGSFVFAIGSNTLTIADDDSITVS